MFLKADGTEVWLHSTARLPYLSMAGVIETSEDYLVIRSRLREAYKPLYGLASDDTFLIRDEDGALLFCAGPDKNCALLLLGEFCRSGKKGKPSALLEDFIDIIDKSVNAIARYSGATIHLQVIKTELAIGGG
ncbi:hypothetical protein ABIE89_000401 [Bradyrhizobium niftali]|uniref:hypothetical protein n=1 Tax=Bradyrhizobium niftali TaxID=2560055 RepID=UPI00383623CC